MTKRSPIPEDLIDLLAEAATLLKQRQREGKKKTSHSRKAPVSLTEEEILKMLAAARKRRIRDWILMLVTYRHGLRASEALAIRRQDVEAGFLRVRRGKDSEETEHELQGHDNPLLDEVTAVAGWLGEMGQRGKKGAAKPGGRRSRAKILQSTQKVKFRTDPASELLFLLTRQRFFQLFRQLAIEIGLPPSKRHPHVLKHSCVVHLLKRGVPINEVMAWVGWKSIKTADHYTRVSQAEVDRSVERAFRAGFRDFQQGMLFSNPEAR